MPVKTDYDSLRTSNISSKEFFKRQITADDRVLDLGTKHGRKLEEVSGEVTAVDISNDGFRQGESIVEFVLADGRELPFGSASFDYVYCDQVLEHVPDTGELLAETARVLKRDGAAYFGFPNRLSLRQPHSEVPRYFSMLPRVFGERLAPYVLDENHQKYYENALAPLSPIAARYHMHVNFQNVVYPMRIDPASMSSSESVQRLVWLINSLLLYPPLSWFVEFLWPAATYVCSSPKHQDCT